jgi:CHAT domain-containing protein/cytochrome c-type biogenesis protein CcmH/NrfG
MYREGLCERYSTKSGGKDMVPNARNIRYRHLLGASTDEEMRKIEARSCIDADYRERLRETEYELIAAYIAGDLTLGARARFETYFLRSKARIEKLKLAKLLFERAKNGTVRFTGAGDPFYGYFLGELVKDEKVKIEQRVLVDDDYREQLESAEHELIAAYTFEDPSGTEREKFQRYFFDSDERIEKLRFAESVYEYIDCVGAQTGAFAKWFDGIRRWLAKPIRISMAPRPIWQHVATVSAICLGLFIWISFIHKSAIDQGLLALTKAYAEARPVEARISDFEYAAYAGERGGDSENYKRPEHSDATHLISSATVFKANKSAKEYYALGKLYLADRDFNQAASFLDLALKQGSNAKFYNDLAVALMAKEQEKQPGESTGENYAEALEYLHRAIELDESLLEAHFNLALCRQYQKLWRQAADDWRKYLERDTNSRWADEARSHLTEIDDLVKKTAENREKLRKEFKDAALRRDGEAAWQAFRNSRAATGSFIVSGLIDDYLLSRLAGRTADADATLQSLLFIGDFERAKTNDRFTYDLANFYRGAGPQQLQRASEARALFKSAAEDLRKSLLDDAVSKCRQAQFLFNQLGNAAEALLAQHLLGHFYRLQGGAKLSLPLLTQGAQECETKNYLWMQGVFHNALRNTHVDLTQYSKADEHNQKLIAGARAVEDDLGLRLGLQGTSEIYMYLGRYRESLQAVQEGLALASKLRAPPSNFLAFYILATKSYLGLGKLAAALDYQKEGLTLSLEVNDLMQVSRHYTNLGLVYNQLGRRTEAVEAIQKAADVGNSVRDEKQKGGIVAFANLCMGQVYQEMGKYDDAARAYDVAHQFYTENATDNTVLLFRTAKGRLLTAIRRGDDTTAAQELDRVIDFYEDHRMNIDDEASRTIFFDREQGVYDIAVDFAYSRQNDRLAFDYSEMSRARSLLATAELPEKKLPEGPLPEVRLPNSIKPLSLDQIQAQMPDRSQLLQYVALEDKLIIWVVSKNDLKSQIVPIGQAALSAKVTAYLESLEAEWRRRGTDSRPQATELYKILIEPVESQLNKDSEVCIVPDKILHRLPFAALIAPKTGKYLIEERALTISPSANMFLVSTNLALRKGGVKAERLLAVGNPQFDRNKFPSLKDLPNAATQAWEAAAFYDAKLVVLNGKAKEAYIRQEIEKSDVIDFAMHYVADERSPLLSILPLAGEKSSASKAQDGMLYTYELYAMNLSRLRLAVLSGCQTGIETFYRGEGAISLARAFQAAGVPLVVASLWKAQDYQAKELIVAFHKHRKQSGLTTAQALRQAQLEQIRSIDPQARSPYHWATFVVIGGRADF